MDNKLNNLKGCVSFDGKKFYPKKQNFFNNMNESEK